MSPQLAYQQYKEVQVKTANQGELIIMLYQGTIKFLKLAKKYIELENIEKANHNLIKAQNIVNELNITLDKEKGGELAENLSNLYDYMNRKLIDANIKKDIADIELVEDLMKGLLISWQEIINKSNKYSVKSNS